ncbi:MAG: glycosyltransferase family 2 protein [Bacteroidales bacterium]|nr:glycosyltransferase family 2 protein [Bacteroidales bacterium]
MKTAALLTCHNRKVKTLACLKSLFGILPEVEVYLTDDGCTDGTAEMVKAEFPTVHIVEGDGSLYWSRGMLAAWMEAIAGDYDEYLWLNDDVELYPDFYAELKACCPKGDCIVSGLIEDFEKTRIIYGGYDASKQLVQATGQSQAIGWMNGNVVLVPNAVVEVIGLLDPVFVHDLGDVDYGMRAREHGISVVSTRRPIAAGYRNDVCRVRKWGTSLVERFKALNKPLGSPLGKNFYFRRKHFGLLHAIAYNANIILINLLPDWLVEKIWGDLYVDK